MNTLGSFRGLRGAIVAIIAAAALGGAPVLAAEADADGYFGWLSVGTTVNSTARVVPTRQSGVACAYSVR